MGQIAECVSDEIAITLTGDGLVMNRKFIFRIGFVLLGMQLPGCGPADVSFSSDVMPLFEEYCIECHDSSGEGVVASGFSVSDYESVIKGTKFGQVVIPGSSISSTLYLVVAQKTDPEIQMPPHHAEAWAEGRGVPLSEQQVGIIQAWIDQGAQNN